MSVAQKSTERRIGVDAIPEDLQARLTEPQRHALSQLEGFGWSIKFVRRPLFQDPVIVLVDPSGEKHAVLTEDGSIDRDPDFIVRGDEAAIPFQGFSRYVENITVEEGFISEKEWAQFVAERPDILSPAVFQEKRGTKSAVPEIPAKYITRLQLSRIRKMEKFDWKLLFVRRANPAEALVVMHLPRSRRTAVIEKDGEIIMTYGATMRSRD